MKKQIYILLSVSFFLMIFSCRKAKKTMKEYYPEVNTVSATINPDGDVVVQAEIISEGEKPLKYIGFCMDTLPVPNMLSNQIVVTQLNGNSFSTTYQNFDPKKTYYFRSWAANGNGYTYGNIIAVTNIKGTPTTPPCSLTANYLNLGTGTGSSAYLSVGAPVQNFTWDFQAASFSSGTLSFMFGSKPRSKVFTTTTNNSPNSNEVGVTFVSGFVSGSLSTGTKVYVNEISTGVYDISICQAPWKYNTSTFYLNTRFTCPY